MPLYDVHCNDHGYFRDIFAKLSEVDTLVCKICGKPVRRVVSPVMTVVYGSKPLKLDQVGRTFTSNDQWRTYLKANPNAQVLSANSKDGGIVEHGQISAIVPQRRWGTTI